MSTVFRRGISTIIPPKVASPSLSAAKDAARMSRVVEFYKKLPRGAAPDLKPSGPWGRYRAKYFGKNPSAAPLLHLLVGMTLIGYTQQYYFHLRHHKNNAH